jgi:hypothetical protein
VAAVILPGEPLPDWCIDPPGEDRLTAAELQELREQDADRREDE